MFENKNILIAGTGAIGGYFGGKLSQNKKLNVFFLSRGETLKKLQTNGLIIKSIDKDFKINISVSDNPKDFNIDFDYIFISVKSQDTLSLLKILEPVVSEKTQILTLQNGLYNYNLLKDRYGIEKVLQGICKIGVEMIDGIVNHSSLGIIITGEENGKRTQRISELEELFRSSDIKIIISDNIKKEIWIKFGWNVIFNSMTAIYMKTVDELFANDNFPDTIDALYKEFSLIAKSQGVELGEEGYKKIISDSKELGKFKTSAYQDKIKGKPLEIEYFLDDVLNIARKEMISIPEFEKLHSLNK